MQRLYEWTPDECIPDFYDNANVFTSQHSDMSALALPEWCPNEQEFIKWHRNKLDSDRVAQQLHEWIDLVFGYKVVLYCLQHICIMFNDLLFLCS